MVYKIIIKLIILLEQTFYHYFRFCFVFQKSVMIMIMLFYSYNRKSLLLIK